MNTCKSIGCNTQTNNKVCNYHIDFYIVYNCKIPNNENNKKTKHIQKRNKKKK